MKNTQNDFQNLAPRQTTKLLRKIEGRENTIRMLNLPNSHDPVVFKEDPYIKSMLQSLMAKKKTERNKTGPRSVLKLVTVDDQGPSPKTDRNPSRHFFAIDRPMGHTSELTKPNRHKAVPFGESKRLFVESPTCVPLKRIDVDPPKNNDDLYKGVYPTHPSFIDLSKQVDRRMKPLKLAQNNKEST